MLSEIFLKGNITIPFYNQNYLTNNNLNKTLWRSRNKLFNLIFVEFVKCKTIWYIKMICFAVKNGRLLNSKFRRKQIIIYATPQHIWTCVSFEAEFSSLTSDRRLLLKSHEFIYWYFTKTRYEYCSETTAERIALISWCCATAEWDVGVVPIVSLLGWSRIS